jgi:subtilisin family serine protease
MKVVSLLQLAAVFLLPFAHVAAAPSSSTYFPGQLIVKFKPGWAGNVRAAAPGVAGAKIKASMPRLGWQLIQLPEGMSVATALDYYRSLPEVAGVEPNYRIRLFKTPNDPRWPSLWGLQAIHAAEAWEQTIGSSNIIVATLDTGVDYNHPDLAANIWTNPGEIPGNGIDDDGDGYVDDVHGFNVVNHSGDVLDDDGHGTHVAGTIGAIGNNALGVVGINWNVRMLPVKLFTADDTSGTAGAVEGYEYLLTLKSRGVNIRVVNNSWGGPVPSHALLEAIRAAEAAGIVTVCAAGNDHHNSDYRPDYPAGLDCETLISVAACTSDDAVASFSNYGPFSVDLAAPGENVLSTYRGGLYMKFSGTSMATPHVAGAAALLLAQNNSLTPANVKALLVTSVDPLHQWQGRVRSGGRLNLGNAMTRLVTGPLPGLAPNTNEPSSSAPRLRALSRNAQGRFGEGASLFPSLSTNGQWVAYLSAATNLVSGVTTTNKLVYVHDRTTRLNTLISRANSGALPNADCANVHISGNGRYVVFDSAASNLIAGDSNGVSDVFLYDRNTGQLELISKAGAASGNGASDFAGISDDGRYVVFASSASNLVTGDSNGYRDIFVRDRQLATTARVSISSTGAQADYTSDLPSISGDGRYVTFLSGADNLVTDTYFPAYHLYLRDRTGNTTVRLSKTAANAPGAGNCGFSSLSSDGRYIAFESMATNLVTGDTNQRQDIFLKDRVSGSLSRISLGNTGTQADDDCWGPFVAANGRHIFFYSAAASLCEQDDDSALESFDYDRLTGKLSRLTYNGAGETGFDNSFTPTASADGKVMVFSSWAWNLVPGDGNGAADVFVLERGDSIPDLMIYTSGETIRHGIGLHDSPIIQRRQLALTNNPATFFIRLDNDGSGTDSFVIRANPPATGWDASFFFGSTNVTAAITGPGWTNSLPAGSNLVVRLDANSVNAAVGESWAEWVIVASGMGTNSAQDTVRAVVTRTPSPPALQIVSRSADGRLGNDDSGPATLSGDGHFVAFTSRAANLTSKDYNLQLDVFVADRQTQSMECLSKGSDGETGNGRSYSPRISRDGRYVVFQSTATNLVVGDTNDREDVFMADRQAHTTTRVSVGPGGIQSSRDSTDGRISGDGRYVVFESLADNFTSLDLNGTWDIFLRDTVAGTIQCLSLAGSGTANNESHSPIISNDGSLVVFSSLADNLAPGDTNGVSDLFLWQRGVSGVLLLSRTKEGLPANDTSSGGFISDDNRYVLFSSFATNLAVANYDSNSVTYLYDRQTSQLSQLNPPWIPGRQRGGYYGARLAPNGRTITLLAEVFDVSGGTNFTTGVFSYDRIGGTVTELSRRRDGTAANDESNGAVVSADGRYIALSSRAPNLINETTLSTDQVLLYDSANFQPDELIGRGISGPNRGQDEFYPSVQWIEQTIKFGFTNVLTISIRNRGTFPDSFNFKGVTGISGGIQANYYLEPSGTDITATATNAGWFSGVIAVGGLQEIRVQIVVNNTNLFNQDLVFTSTSVADPTKIDIVWLRLLRDDDNDGLPDAWEQKYFGNSANALPFADSDGDGLSNLQEYIAGTDPTSAASQLLITIIEIDPNPASVTLTWPSVTNRYYTVEAASGSPGVFVPLWSARGSLTESSFSEPLTNNSLARFYRIRAELP